MKFIRKSKVRISAKDRERFNSLDIFTAKSALHKKDVSLDSQYFGESGDGDSLMDFIPQEIIKNPYNELSQRELPALVIKVRRLLITEILRQGKVGERLLKYYLAIFDKMMEGQPFSYTDLADKLHISRSRLELLRDGLMRMPAMKCFVTILKKSDG